ncbi:MAG: phosphoribosylformylglycinamidine synthase subunit PurQ, partial [Dehalococcoidales bacterium]
GSINDIAGICDASGRVFGLMPHPEDFIRWTQHPRWTRETPRDSGDGLKLFQNAVAWAKRV